MRTYNISAIEPGTKNLQGIAAFDDYLADPPTPSLLALPFGAGSRRWALTHEGLASLRQQQGPF